jgi:uncharacterized protein YbaP (TraB family)
MQRIKERIQWIAAFALFIGGLLLATGYAHAEPALWVVKGPHAKVYLFGSVHVLKKDAPWRTPKIDAAIKESGTLWLEIPDVDDMKTLQPLIMKLGVDQEHPLSTKLTRELLAMVDTAAKAAGVPAGEASLEPLKPWLAAVTLSVAPMTQAGFDPNSGVEMVLKPEFDKAGKPVKGFETSEQQLHYFADMSEKAQIDFLNSTTNDSKDSGEKFKKLVDAWYAGDEAQIDSAIGGEFRDKYPEAYRTLILSRNENFTQRIDGLLNGNGVSFVAIGVGHLVGADGVVAKLKEKGWTVVRL